MAHDPDSPHVIALPPILFAAGLLVAALLHWWLPRPLMPRVLGDVLGGVLLTASGWLAIWAHHVMVRAGTNVDPRKPATAVVTDGPFRFTRNPLYVSMTMLYLAIALFTNDVWFLPVLVVLLLVVTHGVVRREERYLRAKFGDEYGRYAERVRRWL